MYLKHFGLTQKPFSLIPDPEFLHFSKKHKTAYIMLEYGLFEQTGITLITGEVGSGKTTLLRHLLNQIDQTRLTIGLINNTHESLGDLIHWIALAFDIDHKNKDKVTLYRDIQKFLISQYSKKKRSVLIIDEAQNMNEKSLEELRLMTNINANKDHLLQIMLIGQPELADILQKPNLSQIAQRISVEYHLNPLNLQETYHYIKHRIKVANGRPALFDVDAMSTIFYYTGGIPRLINILCDSALVYAYATDSSVVSINTVLEVVKDRKISGLNHFIKIKDEIKKVKEDLLKKTGVDITKTYS